MIGLRLFQSLLQISIAFYRILTIAIIWFALIFKQIEPRIFHFKSLFKRLLNFLQSK